MPNIAVTISPASSRTPACRCSRRPGAEDGMNLAVSTIKTMPIGTLTRKMPRQDQ